MLARLASLALAVAAAFADKVTLLPPLAGKTGELAAWILLPGAFIDNEEYRALGEAVQKECAMPLWVAVLGTTFTPSPVAPEIGPRIDHVLRTMRDQGLDLARVKLFYGGHSLGSIFIQDHLQQYHGDAGPMSGKVQVLGQVLLGGFIQRKYAYPDWSYAVSTLTVGGELDGLARPTRLAEAFFHARGRSDFPVVILPGVTHNQFASGKNPVTLVRLRDLEPEVSSEEAHAAIARVVAPYFESRSGAGGRGAELLRAAEDAAAEFVRPIVEAYQMEGGRYFGTPEQFGGPLQKQCRIPGDNGVCPTSCPWAPRAQKVISEVDGWSLNISNQFVLLSSTPLSGGAFHLPVITSDESSHRISITTYSQNSWDDAQPSWFQWKEIFDEFDTGYVATSAVDIATKLASRQCSLLFGAGERGTSFDVDSPDFCMETNKQAYQWALERAGAASKKRYEEYGEKYTFGKDIPKQGGPLFIDAHVQYDEVVDSSGEAVIQISSPMQKTEVDYWNKTFPFRRPSFIPDPGCYHYCKLLSPARVMEWVYVDSLRRKKGLTPAAPTPAPTPAPPVSSCFFAKDQDFDGEDLRDLSSDSQEDCCLRCSSEPECRASVWQANAIPFPSKGHCYLKSGTKSMISKSGRVACLPDMTAQAELFV